MKTFYTLIFCMLVSLGCFADTYYVYTAGKTGNWNDMTVWSVVVRADGVPRTKVVTPSPFVVSVDNGVNSFGLGDVEIKISGSLSLQLSTTIVLSAASSIELLGSGRIVGSSNTQRISINGVIKYNGSLDFTKTGASIASSVSGISPNGFLGAALLPVKFTSFNTVKNMGAVILTWSTASEIAADYFEIQRSYNGSSWTAISTVGATGSATNNANYTYSDNNAKSATIYYRLKQVDFNGTAVYSTVKVIRGESAEAAKIYTTGKTVNIELNTEVKSAVMVTLLNINGQVIEKKQFSTGYKISVDVNSAVNGIVIVHVADNNALNQAVKIML